jgi:hypothetical protein
MSAILRRTEGEAITKDRPLAENMGILFGRVLPLLSYYTKAYCAAK